MSPSDQRLSRTEALVGAEAVDVSSWCAKVEATLDRILSTFPDCDVIARRYRYGAETPDLPSGVDVIVNPRVHFSQQNFTILP